MTTFTVPIFLGVVAESKEEAVELALAFMEQAIDTGASEATYPYSHVGVFTEVIEQEGT